MSTSATKRPSFAASNTTTEENNIARRPLQNLHVNKTERKNTAEKEKTKPQINHSSSRALLRTSSFDAKIDYISVAEKEQVHPKTETIFRRTVWLDQDDEMDDLWTLKRANPITEEPEDVMEGSYASPSKRQRTQELDWNDKISDEAPYLLLDVSVLEKISRESE